MKHFIFLLIVILSGISQVHACGKYPIIPYPKSLQAMEGYFILKNNMQISVPFENKKVHQIADDFTKKLSEVSGLYLSISQENTKADIIFTKDNSLGNEAYLLNIAPERIVVKAATPNGFFYAVQSILQLLPAEICSPDFIGDHVTWQIPCAHIIDEPSFSYRGMMLDVAR